MITRTYIYSDVLTLEFQNWCLLNDIEIDIYQEPPIEINTYKGPYYFAGKSTIKFITRSEPADLMLQIKAGDSIHLIAHTYQS